MSTTQITVEALVAAPVERAWAVFTTPVEITRWNFASADWCCPSASVDLRIGGLHKARMEARDGSFGFDFEGVYEEVEPGRALTLVLGDGRKARTIFAPSGAGTRVTTTFDAETQHGIAEQRAGWQAILDNFAAHAAKPAAP